MGDLKLPQYPAEFLIASAAMVWSFDKQVPILFVSHALLASTCGLYDTRSCPLQAAIEW